MVISAFYVVFFTDTPWFAVVLMLGVMGYGAYFIFTKPSWVSESEERLAGN